MCAGWERDRAASDRPTANSRYGGRLCPVLGPRAVMMQLHCEFIEFIDLFTEREFYVVYCVFFPQCYNDIDFEQDHIFFACTL